MNKDKSVYLPGLNGIRAIASIAVVLSHTTLALKEFNLSLNIFGVNSDGSPKGYLLASYGVTMFFVLSGFLITFLLQKESEQKEINIKKFYIRRILRIWPLYYFYITLCLIAFFSFGIAFNFKSLIYYLFFAANVPFIFNFTLPFLNHFWSIGVEEQFYLFWPWVIKKVKKRIIPLLIILIIIQNIIRVLLWYFYPFSESAIFSMVNRFDCMMIGALGAFLYKQKNPFFLKLTDNKISQGVALLILGLLIINKFHINAIVDSFIISIVTLIIIVGQINIKNRLLSFDNKIFDFLGKISYGVYVYHPLLIFLFSVLFSNIPVVGISKYILVYLSILCSTIIIAYLSFELFETRFIKLKDKFAVVKSSGYRKS